MRVTARVLRTSHACAVRNTKTLVGYQSQATAFRPAQSACIPTRRIPHTPHAWLLGAAAQLDVNGKQGSGSVAITYDGKVSCARRTRFPPVARSVGAASACYHGPRSAGRARS